jgi:hypothetical protein
MRINDDEMSHFVTALIAKAATLATFASQHSLREPIPFVQGFSILPLCDQDFESLTNGPTAFHSGFTHWSERLSEELAKCSKTGTIVYFETEYFGGVGLQAAVAYDGGSLVFGPTSSKRIGRSMKHFGFSASRSCQQLTMSLPRWGCKTDGTPLNGSPNNLCRSLWKIRCDDWLDAS